MKIKNTIPDSVANDTIIGIVCLFLFSLCFLIFTLWLCTEFNPEMSIIESLCKADVSMKVLCSITLIFPILCLLILINQIQARRFENEIASNTKDFINYIDFSDNKIILSYLNPISIREIYYNDINSMELVIDTYDSRSKYNIHPSIEGMHINIIAGSNSYSIYYSPVNLNKLYKIIFYSQYMKSFSYLLTGDSKQMKKELGKSIDNYIRNNYRKTLFSLFK